MIGDRNHRKLPVRTEILSQYQSSPRRRATESSGGVLRHCEPPAEKRYACVVAEVTGDSVSAASRETRCHPSKEAQEAGLGEYHFGGDDQGHHV